MAKLRYLIRRLSAQAMLSYAKPIDQDTYSFALTPAQMKSVIMGRRRYLAGGQRHFLSGYVYLKRFTSREELVSAIEEYIRFYNTRRYQKRLNCMTPCEYYFATAV